MTTNPPEPGVSRAKEIFLAALDVASPQDRGAFLAAQCGGDHDLCAEVEALLTHDAAAGGGEFLAPPAIDPREVIQALDPPALFAPPGTMIGRYKILEAIGEGGYGTVFMAEQTTPVQRKVALKIIKAGMDTRQVIARFEAERQALALMDHPNIAKVFDAGVTESGRPYFVMELVKGIPVTKHCDEHKLTPKLRLELFIQVCHAVQHAHQKGIIHRDLKPSNVLVAQYDGRPMSKVIDFGVAKAMGQRLTEATMFTGFGDVIGTPQYMSPEQAELNQLDVDTRSDIYSLGVLLYELLTGTTPLEGKHLREAALLEVLRVIREEEPPRPSTRLTSTAELPSIAAQRGLEPKSLSGMVKGELDWIVMKSLEKDRSRRYETANAMAMDVQRYLNDETVQACPPSTRYRTKKFVRRNKAALMTASVVGVALLFAVGSFGWMMRDRSARHAKMAGQVELILTEVDQLERQQIWPEALVAARRAEAVLTGGDADAATARRTREWLRDLELIDLLEQIRMQRAVTVGGDLDNAGAERAYARAFREYGVDLESLPIEKSIDRLKARPTLSMPLAAALQDWANVRVQTTKDRYSNAFSKRLIAIARAIDPEPLRDWLRSRWGKSVSADELRRVVGALDMHAHHPSTLCTFASRLAMAKDPDAAVKLLRAVQSVHPGDFWTNYDLAHQLAAQKDHQGAIRFLTAAVSIRPHAVAAHNNLGLALMHQKKLDEAVTAYNKAIELDPKSAGAYVNLGLALVGQQKFDEAAAAFRKAIDLDPKDGSAYGHVGRPSSVSPQVAAYGNLGILLRTQGKLDEAAAVWRELIERDPKLVEAHFGLGRVLVDQKKLPEAVAAFKKGLDIDPKFAEGHNDMAWLLATAADPQMRDPAQALALAKKAVELEPKNGMYLNTLGVARYRNGDWTGAIADLDESMELRKGGDSSDWFLLAMARWHLGEKDKAREWYDQAVKWMEKNAPKHPELIRFRDEASALLGVNESK